MKRLFEVIVERKYIVLAESDDESEQAVDAHEYEWRDNESPSYATAEMISLSHEEAKSIPYLAEEADEIMEELTCGQWLEKIKEMEEHEAAMKENERRQVKKFKDHDNE